MPSRILSQQEFEAIKSKVIAGAPSGLSEQEFYRWVGPRLDGAIAEAEHTPQAPEGSAAGRFVSNLASTLNPVNIVKGVYQSVRHPVDTAMAIGQSHVDQFKRGVDDAKQGRYVELAGRMAATALPVLGPMAAKSGDQIASGDVAGGFGSGAGLIAPTLVAGPVVRATGRAIGRTSTPLVRSAIKPTITDARHQAGASMTGMNAQADRLAGFIAENGITTRAKAQAIVEAAERELQAVLSRTNPVTDAPQRASRYLGALSRSASRQGLPADDVAIIRSKAAELIQSSPLSETVTTTVMKPSPTGMVTASGQPVMVPTPVQSRALRTDVRAQEAMELARGSGRWSNRKSWGEQKGAAVEASKAVERAERDAAKVAVPEARPILRKQGQAIQARTSMDRMAFREANREPISPFDVTTAAVEIGSGRVPLLSMARNFLRNNKLKMGVWAKRLERAIEKNDIAAAAVILDRFGVSRAAATSPSAGQQTQVPATATP